MKALNSNILSIKNGENQTTNCYGLRLSGSSYNNSVNLQAQPTTILSNHKIFLKIFQQDKCWLCERNFFQLDVHHIDNNHSNNIVTNLVALCHMCHMFVHKSNINEYSTNRIRPYKKFNSPQFELKLEKLKNFSFQSKYPDSILLLDSKNNQEEADNNLSDLLTAEHSKQRGREVISAIFG